MTRVALVAVLLALVAVCTPSPTGPVHLPVAGHHPAAVPAPVEEEPPRECRIGPEPRTCTSSPRRAGAAHRDGAPDRPPAPRQTARAPHLAPRVDAADHLHTRLTPPVLQVFRN